MAEESFTTKVIVLKKTKLKESDLIITALAEDGSKISFVAKGARKPKGGFASRLELFSCTEILCAATRGLPIAKEARLLDAHSALRSDFTKSAIAACIAQTCLVICQENLGMPRFFNMVDTALGFLNGSDDSHDLAICAAALIKALAFAGVRPELDDCCCCGRDAGVRKGQSMAVSFTEGGVLCDDCDGIEGSVCYDAQVILWAKALLMSSFAQIMSFNCSQDDMRAVLGFLHIWMQVHIGNKMATMPYLFEHAL